jgi:hypothetical protein
MKITHSIYIENPEAKRQLWTQKTGTGFRWFRMYSSGGLLCTKRLKFRSHKSREFHKTQNNSKAPCTVEMIVVFVRLLIRSQCL